MSNIENIIERIKAQAHEEIEEISSFHLQEGQHEADKIRQEAKNEAEKILKNAEDKASRLYEQTISAARLKKRDEKIQKEQEFIDRIFALAVEKFNSQSNEDFEKMVIEASRKLNEEYELVVPKSRRKYFTKKGYKLADESISDGFILKTNSVDYNNKFTDMLSGHRQALAGEIVKNFLG